MGSIRSKLLVATLGFLLAIMVSGVVPMIGLRVLDNTTRSQYALTRDQLQTTIELSNASLYLSSRAAFLTSNVQLPLQNFHAASLQRDMIAFENQLTDLCEVRQDCELDEIRSGFHDLRNGFDKLIAISRQNSLGRDRIQEQAIQIGDTLSALIADPSVSTRPESIGQLQRIDNLLQTLVVADNLFHAGELRREVERLMNDLRGQMHSVSVHETLLQVHQELSGDERLFEITQDQILREQEEQRKLRDIGNQSTRLSEAISRHFDSRMQSLEDSLTQTREKIENGFRLLIALLIVCCAFALGVGRYVWVHVTGGLNRLRSAMRNLAEHNMHVDTSRLPFGDDEIGEMSSAFQVFYENKLLIDRLLERLQSRTTLIDSTIRDMRDGFLLATPDGEVMSHNPRFQNLLRLNENPERSIPVKDWITTSSLSDENIAQLLDGPQAITIEDAGVVLEVRQNKLPNGRHLWIVSDTTSSAMIERRLKKFQRLEDLGLMAGEVAHDVRNILSVLEGYLSLLESDPDLTRSQRKFVQKSRASVETGTGLTHRLLAFARRQELHNTVVDLRGVVGDIEDILDSVLGENTELRVQLGDEPLSVRLDPTQMESALINLCTNAAQAIDGSGSVTLDLSLQDEKVVVEVTDTGCGMNQATLDRAIDPFFTLNRKGNGTGLGLSMVYGFVEQSGGELQLTSDLGKGTTVRLEFPLAQDTVVLQPVHSNATVLVVDDDSGTREHLQAELLPLTGRVILTDSPEAALSAVDEQGRSVDLVLCDLDLGQGQSGWDLMRAIHAKHPDLRMVAMSGGQRNAIPPDDLQEICQFMKKPIDVATALKVLDAQSADAA